MSSKIERPSTALRAATGAKTDQLGSRSDPQNGSRPAPKQVTWEEVYEYLWGDNDPINSDRFDFMAVAIGQQRYLRQGNPPIWMPVERVSWPPGLFLAWRIRGRRHPYVPRPPCWCVECPVCKQRRGYSFDPFRGRKLFSLARDCPRRLDVSDEDVPPTSALRAWICPASFWKPKK
jgi:hypothetical protein